MPRIRVRNVRLDQEGVRKALGELEAEVMELMWLRRKAAVREIHSALLKRKPIAYTTIMTVMSRLADKGILKKERDGNHYLYTTAVSEEEFGRSVMNSVLAGIQKDLDGAALIFFMENLPIDGETLSELEQLLKKKRERLDEA